MNTKGTVSICMNMYWEWPIGLYKTIIRALWFPRCGKLQASNWNWLYNIVWTNLDEYIKRRFCTFTQMVMWTIVSLQNDCCWNRVSGLTVLLIRLLHTHHEDVKFFFRAHEHFIISFDNTVIRCTEKLKGLHYKPP